MINKNQLWQFTVLMLFAGAAMASAYNRDQGGALLSYTQSAVAGGPSPYAAFIRTMLALFGLIVVIHTMIQIGNPNPRNPMGAGTAILRLVFGVMIFAAPKLMAVVADTFPVEAVVKISQFMGS